MNKKYLFLIIIIIIILAVGAFIIFYKPNNQQENQETNTARLATTTTNEFNESTNLNEDKVPIEEELSSYSTNLKSKKSGRLNNIRITCEALTNTIVSPR